MNGLEEFAQFLVLYCSPTLAGVKTGNMFNYTLKRGEKLEAVLEHWNQAFRKKGIHITVLRSSEQKALLYVYRKRRLEEILSDKEAHEILGDHGYPVENMEECVCFLRQRCREASCFPHEIGVFLGYPIHDVIGFIENQGKNCRMCGCWKVYCEEEKAGKTFALYERCRSTYCRLLREGKSILQLTVAA